MLKRILFGSNTALAIFLPLEVQDHDKVSPDIKTVRDSQNYVDTETGKDRLKMIFYVDEVGTMSPEINSIYQAGFLGFLFGAVYGGVIHSRIAYLNFMETNQATAFRTHFEAKRKLQDKVTVSFAKGAFRWGWRLSFFTMSYVTITTFISVYRNKSSIYEYLIAGAVTGAGYKVNLGLRGMLVGAGLGATLGGIGGGVSLLILRLTGTSMQDVRFWQYKWRTQRDHMINESIRIQLEEENTLLKEHDESLPSKNLTLDSIK